MQTQQEQEHKIIAQEMQTWNSNFLNKFCKTQADGTVAVGESATALFSISTYPVEVDVIPLQGDVLESVWRFAIAVESSQTSLHDTLFNIAWDLLFFLHKSRKSGLIDEVLTKTLAPENTEKLDARLLFRLEYAVSRGIT